MQFKIFVHLYVSKCTAADFIQDMQKKVKIGTKLDNLNLFTSDITAFWNERLYSLVNHRPSIRLLGIASLGTAILTLTT
jgi:hypothetical protein